MHSVFEPFLDWIMELYQKFYSDVAIDEFLEKADVYFQARSVIKVISKQANVSVMKI